MITIGNEFTFNNTQTNYTEITYLTDTKFVVVFRDESNSGAGTAVIGDIDINGNIVYGANYIFVSFVYVTSVKVLSSTSFVVCYNSNNTAVRSIIGTVSGNTITYGSTVLLGSATNSTSVDVTVLSSTLFVCGWNSSTTNKLRACSISGTVITAGTAIDIDVSLGITIKTLTTTSFAILYVYSGFATFMAVGTVSGTTITYGTPTRVTTLVEGSKATFSVIDSTHILAILPNADTLVCNLCTIATRTITTGTNVSKVISGTSTNQPVKSINLSSTNHLFTATNTNTGIGYLIDIKVNSDVITIGDKLECSQFTNIGITALSTTQFIMSYRDTTNTNYYGTNIIGTWLDGKKINGITYIKWNNSIITKFNNQ